MPDRPAPSAERTFTQTDVDRIVGERLSRDRQDRGDVRVTHEPRIYGFDSPHSFLEDACVSQLDPHSLRSPGAHSRLARYATELAYEMDRRSLEGRHVERVLREATRMPDAELHERRHLSTMRELRALTTGGGTTVSAPASAAAMVVPYFLVSEWAPFRGVYRTFVDQCYSLPIPPYGMQVEIPAWITTDAEASQTELSGVANTAPTSSLQTGAVTTVTGQVSVTQAMLDRGFGGAAGDLILARDLAQRLDEKTDLYALNQTIASAGSFGGAATFTIDNLYQDLATAREGITDTPGVRLRPTHLFTTSDLYSYFSRRVDTTDRPYVQPTFGPGNLSFGGQFPTFQGADDGRNGGSNAPKWARFSGTVLPAGILWFLDDNIPASGANTQLVLSSPDQSVYVFESTAPILVCYPQAHAESLTAVLNLRGYVAVVTRHASGTQVFSGAAYPTTLK